MITLLILTTIGQQYCQQITYIQQPQQYVYYAAFVPIEYEGLIGEQQRVIEKEAREENIQKRIEALETKRSVNQDNDDPPLPENFIPSPGRVAPPKPEINPTDEDVPVPPIPFNVPQTVANIFKANCLTCHNQVKKPALFTNDGSLLNPSAKLLLKIDFQIRTNRMPKNGTPLSDKDKQTINDWITSQETVILSSLK